MTTIKESRLIPLKINTKLLYQCGRVTWITAIPIWAEAKNFQYNTVLNSCNLSLPCLYNHLSVLIGKQSLLYFSFTLVPAKYSVWFFIDILLLVWAFGVISQWFVAFLQSWPLKMLSPFLPVHSVGTCWSTMLQPSLFPPAVGDMLLLDWSWMKYLWHLEQFAPTSNCMK